MPTCIDISFATLGFHFTDNIWSTISHYNFKKQFKINRSVENKLSKWGSVFVKQANAINSRIRSKFRG